GLASCGRSRRDPCDRPFSMRWPARMRSAVAAITTADRGIRWSIAIPILTITITIGPMWAGAGGSWGRRRGAMRGRAARRRRRVWYAAGSDRRARHIHRDRERGNNAQNRGDTQAGLAEEGRRVGAHLAYRRAAVLE